MRLRKLMGPALALALGVTCVSTQAATASVSPSYANTVVDSSASAVDARAAGADAFEVNGVDANVVLVDQFVNGDAGGSAYITEDGRLVIQPQQSGRVAALGPTCRNLSCGWIFTKAQTTALFVAAVAGGAAAAAAACARLGVPALVACIGVGAFVFSLVNAGVRANNKCLYWSITWPGRSALYNC